MAITGGYVVAQASKVTINSGKSTQATIKGLQGTSMPLGATASTSDISVLGQRIATKVATGLSYDNITTTMYYAKGDTTQKYLMKAQRLGTQIQDLWFWLDEEDFCAIDLINDPGGYMMIGTLGAPTATKNDVYSMDFECVPNASHIMFDVHADSSTAVFSLTAGGEGVSATASTSDTTNYAFDDLGFEAGQIVIIHGVTGHLDTVYYLEIESVANDTLTFVDGVGDEATLPTTAAAVSIKIHAGEPIDVVTTF